MIAPSPHYPIITGENRELEYLLLGDLREVLDEPASPQTMRWMLAILDMILVSHPNIRPSVYLPVHVNDVRYSGSRLETGSLFEKLRRLRDRVAHRAGHTVLANEIREELREVMLDRMSSAACLYDA